MKKYKKLVTATPKQFKQIMEVENSTGDGYSESVMLEMWVNGDKNDNFVCEVNGRIVAHISFNPNSKRRNGSIYMVNLTVQPEFRKQGIAQGLILEACKYYITQNNNKIMSLQVDFDNAAAINLYKKVGFEIKEPICEADEDDEQYIMEAFPKYIAKNINKLIKTKEA